MRSRTLPRTMVWGIVILACMGILLPAQPLPAQDAGCRAVNDFDQPRDCTFTEEHGYCLVTALESYYECAQTAEDLLDRVVCEVAVQVDLLACNVALPLTLLRTIRLI